ncbi:MAG: MoxR family ATPase [Lachnospiraceae bacterium]|nr:MoxR family ATPase [Lachnospiraceae bacterium]
MDWQEGLELLKECREQIGKEIVGQEDIVDQILMVILSGGNALLEGMPGLGKTRLVHTISHVFDLSFKRIQFTPDLMPQDITGTSVLLRNESGTEFSFRKGPIFANIVLADEINRATPKTQSAMLEAMQEATVTEAGKTYELPRPYFVLATQNPIETEGTYPLPEAQLDRFLCKLNLTFPAAEDLKKIVYLTECDLEEGEKSGAKTVCTSERLCELMDLVRKVAVAEPVMDHLAELCTATHDKNQYIREGVSPRAAQSLLRMARARAFMQGRYNVSFEDLHTCVYPVFRHRLVLSFDAVSRGVSPDSVIEEILKNHPATKA